jgi:hypothetical protein
MTEVYKVCILWTQHLLGKYVDLFVFPFLSVEYTRFPFLLSEGELYSVAFCALVERR